MWLALGVVKDVAIDNEEGIFVDVQLQPSGQNETAYMGSPYAGGGFGAYFPLKKDDTVLVGVPDGDPGQGCIIIQRYWDSGDPPPRDVFVDGDELGNDVVFYIEPGQVFRVISNGSEGGIELKCNDDGTITMQDGSQSFTRGEDLKTQLQSVVDAFKTFAQTIATSPPAAPNAALTVASVAAAFATLQTSLSALNFDSFLSSKIKGE